MLEAVLVHIGVEKANAGELLEAEEAFRHAIRVNPAYAPAFANLGYILYRLNRSGEAEALLKKGIELDPESVEAYNNLGLVMMDSNRMEEAETCFRHAIGLEGASPAVFNNMGLVLEDTNRRKEAELYFRRAIRMSPEYADAHYNLGNWFKKNKQWKEAELSYRRALKIQPAYHMARFAVSALNLLLGQFDRGWADFNEFRLQTESARARGIPRWQGESLKGRSILLFHEQGFGDTVQFVRYVSKVASSAARVALWVQEPLESLMRVSFQNISVHASMDNPAESFDLACPLPTLPMLFKANDRTILRTVPYLKADAITVERWRCILKDRALKGKCKVGLVWAGNPGHHNDHNRSIPFGALREMVSIPDIDWISLQVGNNAKMPADADCPIIDFSVELTDFSETAGLIANLDLVVTVDSAVAHLSGALGRDTWILLPYIPDWRWQLGRGDSPWYPTARLFRQNKPGSWDEALEKVKRMLKKSVESKRA